MTDVVIYVPGSNTYHRGTRIGDGVATLEADNLDDAAETVVLDAVPEDAEHDQLCQRCFMPQEADA